MIVHVYVVGAKIFPVLDWAAHHEDLWGRRCIIPRILSPSLNFNACCAWCSGQYKTTQDSRNAGWVSRLVWRQWRRAKTLVVAGIQPWFPTYSACSLIIILTDLHRFGKQNHSLRHASCFHVTVLHTVMFRRVCENKLGQAADVNRGTPSPQYRKAWYC